MEQKKYSIAAVSYINTIPMLEGIKKSDIQNEVDLTLASPSECAVLFDNHKVDIALLPVGALQNYPNASIITDYCIGCEGAVNTVAILSNIPFHDIKSVQLDADSRTSNLLIQILAKEYLGYDWEFKFPSSNTHINHKEARLAIGDKVFELETKYKYKMDLGAEWQKHTGLPFTFAVWVSHKSLPDTFVHKLNNAIKMGVDAISEMEHPSDSIRNYLLNDISYELNEGKRKALYAFLEKVKAINSSSPIQI